MKSVLVELGSANLETVTLRSVAEIPVAMPSLASTDTVYAVPFASSLTLVIGGMFKRSNHSPGIGTQTTPLVWRMVKAINSVVASDPAKIKSPSFSRSSSSTTTTASPLAIAAMASSTESNFQLLAIIFVTIFLRVEPKCRSRDLLYRQYSWRQDLCESKLLESKKFQTIPRRGLKQLKMCLQQ